METLLSRMRAGEILPASEDIDALLAGVDLLGMMLEDVDHCNEVDITEPISACRAGWTATGRLQPPRPQADAPTADPPKEPKASTRKAASVDFGSTLRIPVGTLDQLMSQAGELVLLRNQHLLSVDGSDPVSRAFAHQLDLVKHRVAGTRHQHPHAAHRQDLRKVAPDGP
jgi:chemotaxis protein histidine kinase CheA